MTVASDRKRNRGPDFDFASWRKRKRLREVMPVRCPFCAAQMPPEEAEEHRCLEMNDR